MKTIYSIPTYKCDYCNKRFKNVEKAQEHEDRCNDRFMLKREKVTGLGKPSKYYK